MMSEMKIRDYACFNENPTTITPRVQMGLRLKFPEAYKEAGSMARIAKYIREANETPYATLPFCYTVEGEAFGGKVNYGDAVNGPRGAEPVIKKLEEFLDYPDIDFESGRINQVLKAIELLKGQGEKVILKISGPISILNILTEPKNIFKVMRRDPDLMAKVYEKIHKNLLTYISLALEKGVDLISYGDSAVSVPILGEKMMVQYLDEFLVGFLKDAEKLVSGKVPIHLCPKMTFGLIDSGRADFEDVLIDPSLSYGQAFGQVVGQGNLIGSRCINNIKSHMRTGRIEVIRLK